MDRNARIFSSLWHKELQLLLCDDAVGNDDGELSKGCGSSEIVKGSREFFIATVDELVYREIALVRCLAGIGCDGLQFAEQALAVTAQSNGVKLAKALPIGFWHLPGHVARSS